MPDAAQLRLHVRGHGARLDPLPHRQNDFFFDSNKSMRGECLAGVATAGAAAANGDERGGRMQAGGFVPDRMKATFAEVDKIQVDAMRDGLALRDWAEFSSTSRFVVSSEENRPIGTTR